MGEIRSELAHRGRRRLRAVDGRGARSQAEDEGRAPGLSVRWFDWAAVAVALWAAAGGHIDAWAHTHLPTLETFFTPWHAVLYSGLAAATLLYAARWLRDRALPPGYGTAALGCALFAVGGVLDLTWHSIFGIERGVAALLSPTHLLLILAGGLISAGPLLAAWRRPQETRAPLTAILSAALVLTGFTFVTQFDHPWVQQWAQTRWQTSPPATAYQLGFLGVVLQSAFLMGVLLSLQRRFQLPFGTVTLVTGINAIFVTFIHGLDPVILVAVFGGLGGDLLLLILRDRIDVWAAVFPAMLYSFYFLALWRVDGIWWEVHVVAASIVAAGMVGWLLCRVLYTGQSRFLPETAATS